MFRYELVRKFIDKNGVGIEIGPSHNPIAPKKGGYQVQIIDHLDRSGLLEKYAGHNVCLENIEEVDFVWSGQRYADLVGTTGHYDWLIASHVIEHTPDLVAFINDCSELLNDSGVLILVVPDCRRCFDCFRPLTGLSKVIDACLNGDTRHTAGTAVEHLLNVCTKGGAMAWESGNGGTYAFMHTLDEARNALNQAADVSRYEDYHGWCFTPGSFRLMMEDLHSLGLIDVREMQFIHTGRFEFFAILGRRGAGSGMSRLELLKEVQSELRGGSALIQRVSHGFKSLGAFLRRRGAVTAR